MTMPYDMEKKKREFSLDPDTDASKEADVRLLLKGQGNSCLLPQLSNEKKPALLSIILVV